MQCCRCGSEMFTASLVQIEQVSEDLIFRHATQHSECANCGVILHVFIPALEVTRILRAKGKKK